MDIGIKNTLLGTNEFLDNEYLDKYVNLITSNKFTKKEVYKTQRHHIIPRCYYRNNNLIVNNEPDNLVNLLFKDHVLAHCYIVLAAKESKFKYQNMAALYKLCNHRDFKGFDYKSLNEFQLAYESSRKIMIKNNPMFVLKWKLEHEKIMGSNEVRAKISESMIKYRSNNPFSETHRKHLSESMKGNHNWGTGDTRSLNCYCILDTGERHDFHSYLDASHWWFDNYKPFGNKFTCTLMRNIKKSINGEKIIYRNPYNHKETIEITYIKWFAGGTGGDNNEVNKNTD